MEITLDFKVEPNTAPIFSLPIQQNFTVKGTQINYTLPETFDKENNDAVIVKIMMTDGHRPRFPKSDTFKLLIDESNTTMKTTPDSNRTLVIRPEDWSTNNKTYFFSLVVQEKNSEIIKTIYDVNVTV